MATPVVVVKGLSGIYVKVSSGGSWDLLGYTRDGVEPEAQGYYVDVKGDENGGEGGPPIEVQYMGETARIRVELTKYDPTTAASVEARMAGAANGVPAAAGTLCFTSSSSGNIGAAGPVQVKISSPNNPRTYGRCIVRDAVRIGYGTKHSVFVAEWEAHKDASGNLFT